MLLLAIIFCFLAANASITSSNTIFVNYEKFTSEYVVLQGAISDWDSANAACKNLVKDGTSWELGGFYSDIAKSAIVSSGFLSAFVFMGAVVPSVSTTYQMVWTGGRMKGEIVSTGKYNQGTICGSDYCNYASNEPNAATCGTLRFQCMRIYGTGLWDDIPQSNCNLTVRALCERSACNITADCIAEHTTGVVGGYFPQCTCTCKLGYGGSKCQVRLTSYLEDGRQFAAGCSSDAINASAANALCLAMGSEWHLASITSNTIAENTRILTNSTMWTSGTYGEGDLSVWQYGRYNLKTFTTGLVPGFITCGIDVYCAWSANQPARALCGDGSPLQTNVVMAATGSLSYAYSKGCGGINRNEVKCYLCERSLCTMSDCDVPSRTSSASGYYPNCDCQTETNTLPVTATRTHDATNTATSTLSPPISVTRSDPVTRSPSSTPTITYRYAPTNTRIPTSSVSLPHTPSLPLTETHPLTKTDEFTTTSTHTAATPTRTELRSTSLTNVVTETSTLLPTDTQTLTHTHTISLKTPTPTASLAATISSSIIRTFTGGTLSSSLPATASIMPICPVHSDLCPYALIIQKGNLSSPSTTPSPPSTAQQQSSPPQTQPKTTNENNTKDNSCLMSNGLSISIPYSTWSSGTPFYLSVLLSDSLRGFYSAEYAQRYGTAFIGKSSSPSTSSGGSSVSTRRIALHRSQTTQNTEDGSIWVVAQMSYEGPTSRSVWREVLEVLISRYAFSCEFPPLLGGSGSTVVPVPVAITLQEAPALPKVVTNVMDAAVAVGAIAFVPSAMVRAGMMKSIMGMLRCSDFDSIDEVGFLNNPFSWAVGQEVLQYYRGSVITVLIIICVVFCVLGAATAAIKTYKGTSLEGAIDILRLPSLPLVAVLLVAEMCVSSATSMILYEYSPAVDRILGIFTMSLLVGYFGMYGFQVARNFYILVEKVSISAEELKKKNLARKLLHYALEPTHEVVLVNRMLNEGAAGLSNRRSVQWLRRNFYFVTERRWAPFGVIEVFGGTLTNMLEGIPLTTASRNLCIAQPAGVMLVSAVLLTLVLRGVPNAVRLQQWCSTFEMGGLLVVSTLVNWNAVTPSADLEEAAGYLGMVVIGGSMVLNILEMIIILMTYFPDLRVILALRSRALGAVIRRSAAAAKDHEALQQPLLPPQQQALVIPHQQQPLCAHNNDDNDDNILPTPSDDTCSDEEEVDDGEDRVIQQILDDLDAYERREHITNDLAADDSDEEEMVVFSTALHP